MKILLVAHGVTDQSLLGGPGRVAAAQANALTANGHQVTVVTTDVTAKGRRTPIPTFRLLDPPVVVRCIPGRTFGSWPGTIGPVFHPQSRKVLATAISEVDVVHCHEWPHMLVQQARSIARAQGKLCIVQPHGSIQPRKGAKRLMHGLINRRYPPQPGDVFIAGSRQEELEIEAAMGPKVSVFRVVNPMSVPEADLSGSAAASIRATWGFPDGVTVLLYAHRVFPNKGLDLLITALTSLPQSVHLSVVGAIGDAGFAAECTRLTARLNLEERVRFFGPVGPADIDNVIAAGDIFVLPARRDTFPMMVLHAMACARPVVVTETCQSVELLRDAVAVAEPSPQGLATQILPLLEPHARSLLGQRGRELVRAEFGPSAVAKALERLYAGAA